MVSCPPARGSALSAGSLLRLRPHPASPHRRRIPLSISPKRSSPPRRPSKANASRSPCCLLTFKGSLELLADRDAEEARKLLDAVVERMMEAVHHYEGTVNEVRGDGIMALFGAPLAHEDHAVRACYAIRLTAGTLRLAEGFVEVASLGPVPVKGLAEPVETFELLGVGVARTRLEATAERGRSRSVGR